jgi:hypothetical protein
MQGKAAGNKPQYEPAKKTEKMCAQVCPFTLGAEHGKQARSGAQREKKTPDAKVFAGKHL